LLKRHFFLIGALVALALLVLAGGIKLFAGGKGDAAMAQGGGPGGGGGGVQVAAVVAEPRTFTDTIEVIGVAKGRQSVTLTAATTQLVDRVNFRDGQTVPRGAVLLELKATEQGAAVAQARARLVEAERAYDRWKQLSERGFAAKASVDQYEAAYLSAKADVAAAEAQRADRTIRAPFAGVVGLSDIVPGALINPGAPIVTLDDLSAVRVDFEVPERYMAQLREGQAIQAAADAYPGEAINGVISKLDTRVDERSRAITARAEFTNPGGKLKPGMMLRVNIARGARQSVAAPESAVSVQGDSAFVFVVASKDGKTIAEQRPVLTGARQGGFVEIREGLKGGERLVADGLNKIQPNQPVRIAGAKPGAGGKTPAARPAA
jgi:membrane fusion protein, multidrug efflux system